MSIRADLEKLKTGVRELRKFGLMVGGVFFAIGVLFLLRHKSNPSFFLGLGTTLILFGTIWPHALKYVYIAWMALAFTLGFVMSNVILTLFFFLLVTPIGLLSRLLGKDFLAQKWNESATSYWIPCAKETKGAESYKRQF